LKALDLAQKHTDLAALQGLARHRIGAQVQSPWRGLAFGVRQVAM